jgi:eukaryotic-like serine/threonine-protein kinase
MTDPADDHTTDDTLWDKADVLFTEALELPEGQRGPFLERACGSDSELLARVQRLLARVPRTKDFLEDPPLLLGPELKDLFEDADDADPEIGLRLGPYELRRRVGRGGSGTVYLGERIDGLFDQVVAVKVLRRGLDTEDLLRRFAAERQILASLQHPDIGRLIDGGALPDGRPYMLMEYVDGVPITEYCDRHRLTVRQRLELFTRVARAVEYAHQNLVVHRDIKPSNILVTAAGEPKLLDFGIAKIFEADGAGATVTRANVRPMTPEYASPEQLRGEAVTTATDVYQLGMLLYLLLTGRRPFENEPTSPTSETRPDPDAEPDPPSSRLGTTPDPDARRRDRRIAEHRGSEPGRLRRELRGDLDTIVMACLRREPGRRYPSVAALVADVRRFLTNHPIRARPPSPVYQARRFVARRPAVVAVLVTVILATSGYVVSLRTLARQLQAERDQVHAEQRRAALVSDFLIDMFSADGVEAAAGDTLTARALLASGVQRIRNGLQDDPETRSALLLSFGRAYSNLGAGQPGIDLVEESLQLRTALHGESDPRTISALEALAVSRQAARHDTAAHRLLLQAIELRRAEVPVDTASLRANLRRLALVLRDLARPDSALLVFDEAVALRGAGNAVDQPADLQLRGRLLLGTGDLEAAAAAFDAALELRRAEALDDPKPLASLLQNYAVTLRRMGYAAAAEPLYREAMALNAATYGRHHRNTLAFLVGLATVLDELEQHEEAEDLLRQHMAAMRAEWGAESWQHAGAVGELAAHFYGRGDYGAAEAGFREVARIHSRVLGPDHSYTGNARVWIGRSLTAASRFAEAETEMLAALAVLEASPHDAARRWLPAAREALDELYQAWPRSRAP